VLKSTFPSLLLTHFEYAEIKEKYPEDFAARDEDKYNYRYQGGESYRDIVIRLEPIIMELERSENILIITHQAIVRCLYSYFQDVGQEKSPWMDIPLHTLMKLTPRAYGTVTEKYKADIPAVSTWRPKGSTAKHHDSAVEGEAVHLPGLQTPRTGSPKREVEIQGTVLGFNGSK
jgi:broad specificity phosphatase PhoE